MTMFDINVKKALQIYDHSDFLSEFNKRYEREKQKILDITKLSDRQYPYPRRIFDQWLWLQGSDKKQVILNRYRQSLRLAPICSIP